MASPFEQRLGSVLNQGMTSVLKPLGFKRARNSYILDLNEIQQVVSIQRDQYNTRESASFTIEVGVYSPALFHFFYNLPSPIPPQASDCVILSRLRQLDDDHLGPWWNLSASDEASITDQLMADDISDRLRRHGLPLLNRFAARRDILKFLEEARQPGDWFSMPRAKPYRICYIGILHALDGDRERANAAFDSAMSSTRLESALDQIRAVRARVEEPLKPGG